MILSFLFSSVGRYIVLGLLIAAIAGGLIIKIRHDAQEALRVKIEQEKQDAISKATKARNKVRSACDKDPKKCIPDSWYRD